MTDDQRHQPDDERLARLLELADGPRPLPPGEEDRLLADILNTAGQRHVDRAVDVDLVIVGGDPTGHDEPAGRGRAHRRSRHWLAAAATIAAGVAVVAGVALPRLDASQDRLEVGGVAEAGLAGLESPALCDRATAVVADLGLLDSASRQTPEDAAALRELAAIVAELDARSHGVGGDRPSAGLSERASLVAAALRLQAQHVDERDRSSAAATRDRAMSLLTEEPPLLEALGCPP